MTRLTRGASNPATSSGATLRFLDNNNNVIPLATEALHVSNYVTADALPAHSGFADTNADPGNFRLEVEDPNVDSPSVVVSLFVGPAPDGENPDRQIVYTLDKKDGPRYRGEFLRLVTDEFDDAVQGDQTIRCKLGDEVLFLYTGPAASCADTLKTTVGRSTPRDNGANQRRHDIRELHVVVTVFAAPGTVALANAINESQRTIPVTSVSDAQVTGTIRIENEFITYSGIDALTNSYTGCVRGQGGTAAAVHEAGAAVLYSTTRAAVDSNQVNADLDTVDERFAQCAIRLARPVEIRNNYGRGATLPGPLLDGYTHTPAVIEVFNDDELAVIALKSGRANTIDVFYVEKLTVPGSQGESYPAVRNATGISAGQNFIVLPVAHGPLALGHELMHLLLNAPHRSGEPGTALFHFTTPTKAVDGTKRIGPYPNALADGVGNDDTLTLRANVEVLP